MAFASPSKLDSSKLSSDDFNTSFTSKSKENNSTPVEQLLKSPNKVKYESTVPVPLRTQIKELEKKREELEDQGRYLDAQTVHEQVIKLKLAEESRRKESFKVGKQTGLRSLEENYDEELAVVRMHFDRELREFELRVEQGLAEMQERHEGILEVYRSRAKVSLEEALTTKFPPSKRLLEMRRAEKALARQHEYKQAHDVKVSADTLEKQELASRIERARQSARQGEERVQERLRMELSVFEQRNSALRSTILENRRIEETTLTQRFLNKRNEMLSKATSVEGIIERRMEHISPSRPSMRSRLSGNATMSINLSSNPQV